MQVADRPAQEQPEGDRHHQAPAGLGVVEDDHPDHDERHDREHAGRLREHPEQDPGVAPVDDPDEVADRAGTPSPIARLPTTHALTSWSTTTTPIAIAANRTQRADRRVRPRRLRGRVRRGRVHGVDGRLVVGGRVGGRRPPSSSASITGSAAIGPPQRDPHLAGLEPHAAADRVGRRAVPADLVDERLDGHGREIRLHLGPEAVDPQDDPVVQLELGLLAQVLDRALQLAGVALGDERRRQRRVDDRRPARRRGRRRCRAAASPGSRPRRRRASRPRS